MAQSGRFGLSVRVLAVLAKEPEGTQTSVTIAVALQTSPVMVRRVFAALSEAGWIEQRQGRAGGVKLKRAAKAIGLGDVFAATGSAWPSLGEKAFDAVLTRTHADAVRAMNETTIAALVKRMRKS